MHLWGKGMKALNYWWPYAVGRVALIGLKHPLGGLWLLKGFFTSTPAYPDLGDFATRYQKKKVYEIFRRFIPY